MQTLNKIDLLTFEQDMKMQMEDFVLSEEDLIQMEKDMGED